MTNMFFEGLTLGIVIGFFFGGGLGMLALIVVQERDERRGP